MIIDTHNPKFNTCIGPSMYPTMKGGDSYILNRYNSLKDVRIGDIIVYPHPNEPITIVHRIVKKNKDGFITRGDNNNLFDDYIIKYEDIIGWIKIVKRKDKQLIVFRGFWGLLWHKLMLIRKSARPIFIRPIIFISDIIVTTKMLFFIQKFLNLSIVIIKRDNKIQEVLAINKKPIGKRYNNEPWQIKLPYRMFINPKKLK